MKRKILIADDMEINRLILRRILEREYEIIDAVNGSDALTVLWRERDSLSAVLLDLVMPEVDGYTVLRKIQASVELSQIPVIVTTGSTEEGEEVKALSFGANDYITKPYNPAIIKHRLGNTIKLRETAAAVNLSRRDELTGLYNRKTFFERAAELIAVHEPGYYVMACFDIDNFKVINDQYGNAKGDAVLRAIADIFERGFTPVGGICSRITADHFAVLYPKSFIDSDEIAQIRTDASVLDGSIQPITFSIGRYIVDEVTLPVSAMFDRASMAEERVKGLYDTHISTYDESMRERLLREQEIVNDMATALSEKHFEVWYQPQYNNASGGLIGAEALVRWRHPVRGLIPPGNFIPAFERNGFIYELDKYVWDRVASDLRRWDDEGRSPLPIAVNVSRYDIFKEDMPSYLLSLLEKYRLTPDMLRLEITESAFTKSTDQIISVIKQLISYGFTVEIDDFGSGYSSLNTLKDIPASVLKLDMRFLEGDRNSTRGGNIVESVVRMVKWLGMSILAEGVETQQQADFLKSIGCNYVQGYLYNRPMTCEGYESISDKTGKEEKLLDLETVENLDNNTFWDPHSMDTLIFNSYVGGACIFEYSKKKIEVLRINMKYVVEMLGDHRYHEEALKLDLDDYLNPDNLRLLKNNIDSAIDTGDESCCDLCFDNLPHRTGAVYIRNNIRIIARAGERTLFYATVADVTGEREAARRVREAAEQLQFLNDSARDLLSQPDPTDAINKLLRKTMEYFGGERVYIFEIDFAHGLADNTYEVCAEGTESAIGMLQNIPLDHMSYWLTAFENQDSIRIDDTSALGKDRAVERAMLEAQGIRALIAVPLMRDGKYIGFIGVDDPTHHASHIDRLGAIGDFIAVMLTRRDLNERILNESRVLQSLIETMTDDFTRLGNGKTALLYDVPARTLTVPASFAEKHGLTKRVYSFGTGSAVGADGGLGFADPQYPADAETLKHFLGEVAAGVAHPCGEWHHIFPNGSTAFFRIEAKTVKDENGTPVRALITLEDITEQERYTEATEVLPLLHVNYFSMYLIDTEEKKIIPLKFSAGAHEIMHGGTIDWNDHFESSLAALAAPEYRDNLIKMLTREMVRTAFRGMGEFREQVYRQENGSWNKITLQPMVINDGITRRALVTVTDVTESKHQLDLASEEKELRERRVREYERLLFDAAAGKYSSILRIDIATDRIHKVQFEDGLPVEYDMNESWSEYYAEFIAALHPDDLALVRERYHDGRLGELVGNDDSHNDGVFCSYRMRLFSGSYRWYSTTVRVSTFDSSGYVATVFTTDIHADMLERIRLKDLSEHDGLTDLFNRNKLDIMLETEYRELESCAVIFFDINYLKRTNDTLGHSLGDTLLRLVADSIHSVTSRRIQAYRYGGDEFVVIICNAREDESDSILRMWRLRLDSLRAEVPEDIECSVAVGCAWSRAPLSVESLIAEADGKMYENKSSMKNTSVTTASRNVEVPERTTKKKVV